MRQWLVWCLQEKLGDTEPHLFDRSHRRHLHRQQRQQQQHSTCSSHPNDHSVDNIDDDDDDYYFRSQAAANVVNSVSSSPSAQPSSSLSVTLTAANPSSNPRLVRQHAVHERSPRASYGGDGLGPLESGSAGPPYRRVRLRTNATARGESMPPPLRRGFASDDPTMDSRQPNAYGARNRILIAGTTTVALETGVERLTVNEASYSAGSSFESYGSAG